MKALVILLIVAAVIVGLVIAAFVGFVLYFMVGVFRDVRRSMKEHRSRHSKGPWG